MTTKPLIEQETYMPKKCQQVLAREARYRVLYGGRGSAKSYSFADALIQTASFLPVRILCTRELQKSIKDSVHRLLSDRIEALGLSEFFEIKRESIVTRCGALFIFKGLRHDISEIKSTQGINICWVEEAEKVSENSWDILIPTIREPDSEIWISFNPESEKSATYKRFVVNPPPDAKVAHVNYWDNKKFPEVLRRTMEYDKRVDHEKYLHVWEGQVKKYGEACILAKKVKVEAFEAPADAVFHYGCDFGFSNDPLAVGRMFIQDKKLFIDYEFYGVGVEIEELVPAFETVPAIRKWKITADSARPDTISYLNKKGFNIVGAKKGAGSVEDGIQFLRGFEEIVIHPRCTGAIDNFNNFKWKQDKITNEILPIPADGSDHWPDLARYALEGYIKQKELSILWL